MVKVLVVGATGYIGQAWCYLLDKKTEEKSELNHQSLLASAIHSFPLGPLSGKIQWSLGSQKIEITSDSQQLGWRVHIDMTLASKKKIPHKLRGDFLLKRWNNESRDLSLLFPYKEDRPAYTFKPSPLKIADGFINVDGKEIRTEDSVCFLDWTKGFELRETTWRWASGVGVLADGRKLYFNLTSEERFLDKENAIWLDGQIYLPGFIKVTLPHERKDKSSSWIVESDESKGQTDVKVQLEFRPGEATIVDTNFLIVQSKFSHGLGQYFGSILFKGKETISLTGTIFGVGENHYAFW